MRKIILPIIILSLLFGTVSFAQEAELPPPGLTPDSPLYFFDTLGEKVGMFFTFGAEKKAEKALKIAEEKVAEAKAMAEKNKPKAIEKANKGYQEFLALANKKAKEAKEEGRDVERLVTLISEKTLKHQEVLSEVYEKVPEQAKTAIEKAIEVSKKGFEEAIEAVSGVKKEELQQKAEGIKVKIETANWKTYINEKHGYSFRHPPKWDFKVTLTNPETRELYVIREEISNRTETNIERWFITISTWDNPQNLSLGEWLSSWVLPADAPLVANTSVGEEKVEALQVWQGGTSTWDKPGRCFQACPYLEVYFVYRSKGYRTTLNYEGEVDDIDQGSQKIFNQILSTFKFVEIEEVKEEVPKVEEVPKIEEKPIAPDWPAMRDVDVSAIAGTPYTIGWRPVEEATNYILERDTNPSFSNPIVVSSRSSNSFSETLSPPVSTRYYFRVKACNNYGCSSWSKLMSLWVEVCPLPPTPVLTDPGISVTKLENFTVKWTGVSGATKYQVQRDTYANFSAPLSIPDYWLDYEQNSMSGNPNPEVTTTYYYRVKACNDCGCSSWSNVVDMQVIVPSITVISPNGGESWVRGSVQTIRWNSSGGFTYVLADLMRDNTVVKQISVGNSALTGSFTWEIPLNISEGINYKIRLTGSNTIGAYTTIYDESDNYFSIVKPSITVTSPNGGEKWKLGNTYEVTWDSVGVEKVDVSYLNMAIGLGQGIGATGVSASLGKYSFTIPTNDPNVQIGNKYKVYIRGEARDGSRIEDWSDDYFQIGPSPPPEP